MNRKPKVAAMLALIEQRLNAYPLEETLDRLYSYGNEGPGIDEFLKGLEPSDRGLEFSDQ